MHPPKLNADNLPHILRPLIPQTEKWVIEDDAVRFMAMNQAGHEELEELLSSVNIIGVKVIRDHIQTMLDGETVPEEAYLLLKLLELAEGAETELRDRDYQRRFKSGIDSSIH